MNSVVDVIVRVSVWLGDCVFAVLAPLGPRAALVIISALSGLGMLYLWRYTSNQDAISAARRRIAAELLATRLFRDNLAVTFRAQGRIVWQALLLLRHAIRPVLIMAVPFTLLLAQLGLWYEYRPVPAGATVRVKVTLKDAARTLDLGRRLDLPADMQTHTADPCCIPALRTVDWRVLPQKPGDFTLTFGAGSDCVGVQLLAGEGFTRISPQRSSDWLTQLLYSAEPALPKGSAFAAIELVYPTRQLNWFGLSAHWLVVFLVLTVVFALAFKPLVKVQF